jgi:hypothetical protein
LVGDRSPAKASRVLAVQAALAAGLGAGSSFSLILSDPEQREAAAAVLGALDLVAVGDELALPEAAHGAPDLGLELRIPEHDGCDLLVSDPRLAPGWVLLPGVVPAENEAFRVRCPGQGAQPLGEPNQAVQPEGAIDDVLLPALLQEVALDDDALDASALAVLDPQGSLLGEVLEQLGGATLADAAEALNGPERHAETLELAVREELSVDPNVRHPGQLVKDAFVVVPIGAAGRD